MYSQSPPVMATGISALWLKSYLDPNMCFVVFSNVAGSHDNQGDKSLIYAGDFM
jgi:hypothetical protein